MNRFRALKNMWSFWVLFGPFSVSSIKITLAQQRAKVSNRVDKLALLSIALLSSISASTANDWPGFRGPTGQGTSTSKGLPTEWSGTKNIAWKTELPGPGTSSPVVFGNKVFITCYSGFNVPGEEGQMEDLMLHLVCLDRTTGKKLWTTDVKPKLPELEQFRRDQHAVNKSPGNIVLSIRPPCE